MNTVRKKIRAVLLLFPAVLSRFGLVDRRKGTEIFDLALPVMISDGMRTTLLTIDLFMVSLAAGHIAVAAMELSFQYYFLSLGLALALTSGTISVISRLKGNGEHARADAAVKQSLWLALVISIPIALACWMFSEEMIGVFTNDPETITLGAVYLKIVMLSTPARFWSMIAVRSLVGIGDSRPPMYLRAMSVPTNVILNAMLIFGVSTLGIPAMGLAGAAWGTTITRTLEATVLLWLLVSGLRDIRLRVGGKQWHSDIVYEIVRVGLPMVAKLLRTIGRFPFLFVLGVFGTPVLAAYAIGRRVMLLAMMVGWGYSAAASTLVGQAIGAGDEQEAESYGWETLRIALSTQVPIAVVLVVLARPIATAFGTSHVDLTVGFIYLFSVGIIAYSISESMRGGLRGAGDTKWPLYGSIFGTYVLRLPIVFLALPAGMVIATVFGIEVAPGLGFGLTAVYAAILGDMYGRATINLCGFWTGRWKTVARRSGVGAGPRPGDD